MSRFDAPDLSRLPALPLGQATFALLKAARLAELQTRLAGYDIAFDVSSIESEGAVATEEAAAFRELLVRTRQDDMVRAVLLATSWGPFLDAIGATQVPAVARKTLIAADLVAGTAAVMEGDAAFRLRIQLAPEALSTAGPEGAYLSFALAHAGVLTAAVYGPMSFGGTRFTPFTGLGEVRVPIVAAAGDGTAPADLVAAVQAELRAEDRRPLGDFVIVSPATIVPYEISLVLQVGRGADSDVLRTEALRRLTNLTAILHAPGKAALLDQIKGAAYIYDANGVPLVGKVVASRPADDVNAAPITPATPEAAYRAPLLHLDRGRDGDR